MTKFRAVLLRRWPIVVVTTILGMIAGALSASAGAERGLTVHVAEQVIVANRVAGNPANVAQDALKVERGAVPERAAELLGSDVDPDQLAKDINAEADTDSNSITLMVGNVDPEVASATVQAFAEAFLEVVNAELRVDDSRILEQLEERLEDAQTKLEAFDQENGFITRGDIELPNTVTVNALVAERNRLVEAVRMARTQLDEAELRTSEREPYSTLGPEAPRVGDSQLLEVPESVPFRAGLLGGLGLLLGVGLVLVVERVNQRVDTREELAELISVPIIAEIGRIPQRKRPAKGSALDLDGIWSEHYRRVRSAIQFVQAEAADAQVARALGEESTLEGAATAASQRGAVISGHHRRSGEVPRIFLFASALPGEGKSTSVALTAMALAETGTDVLVVNGDFRRPAVERYVGAQSSPSLADRAQMDVERPSVDEVVQATGIDHLWIAAAGPPTHEVGGRLAAAREVAAEAAARGGTVLVDSSPLRVSNDPIDLLQAVDEVILVVRAGRSTVKSIEDTIQLLDMHHAPVLGVVLIGTLAVREMYAYYHSYYHDALSSDDAARKAPESAPVAAREAATGPSAVHASGPNESATAAASVARNGHGGHDGASGGEPGSTPFGVRPADRVAAPPTPPPYRSSPNA